MKLGQVIERISGADLARVDEAHEDIAHMSAVFGFVEHRVLSMEYDFFQSAFAEIVVQWRSGLAQK